MRKHEYKFYPPRKWTLHFSNKCLWSESTNCLLCPIINGGHSSEEPVGSVENESPDRLGGVFILELGLIPKGGAEAVISETPARSSASAKSVILAKRSWGSLASALLTTCSTGAGIAGTSSRRG